MFSSKDSELPIKVFTVGSLQSFYFYSVTKDVDDRAMILTYYFIPSPKFLNYFNPFSPYIFPLYFCISEHTCMDLNKIFCNIY